MQRNLLKSSLNVKSQLFEKLFQVIARLARTVQMKIRYESYEV